MRFILATLLVLTLGFAPAAQTTVTQTPAKVLNFGDLYSTYPWEADALAELQAALGQTLAASVVGASRENAWPTGIASLNTRTENRPLLANYAVFYLATVGNIAVLAVPASANRHMPADLRPASDIYFLVNRSAVELGAASTASIAVSNPPPTPTPEAAENFSSQLNVLAQDFAEGFVHLTGRQTDEDEEGLQYWYESRVTLEGARQVYFTEDLLSASTTFHAVFPGSTDPTLALNLYRKLISKVEATRLSCCGLAMNEEQVEGSRHSQIFRAYDAAGKLPIAYQNMIVEVRMEQGETFTQAGQVVSDWYPVLDIYEQ